MPWVWQKKKKNHPTKGLNPILGNNIYRGGEKKKKKKKTTPQKNKNNLPKEELICQCTWTYTFEQKDFSHRVITVPLPMMGTGMIYSGGFSF